MRVPLYVPSCGQFTFPKVWLASRPLSPLPHLVSAARQKQDEESEANQGLNGNGRLVFDEHVVSESEQTETYQGDKRNSLHAFPLQIRLRATVRFRRPKT